MERATIAVFPGDGIGPEVTGTGARRAGAVRARASACTRVPRRGDRRRRHRPRRHGAAGRRAWQLAQERATRCCSAPSAGRSGTTRRARVRPEQALLGLRRELELFANLRPIVAHPALIDAAPLKRELLEGVDILFVRELTGGVYFGQPSERRVGRRTAARRSIRLSTPKARSRASRGLRFPARAAAPQARHPGRQGEHPRDLAPLARGDARDRGRVSRRDAVEDVLVDAMAMHLLRRPRDFDVVVTENMFGDILTDEASVLTGSLGMLPSASLGAGGQPTRRTRRSLRADPRQRAGYRRTRPRQPARRHSLRRRMLLEHLARPAGGGAGDRGRGRPRARRGSAHRRRPPGRLPRRSAARRWARRCARELATGAGMSGETTSSR